MKQFNIPANYKSSITGKVKASRNRKDPRKQDFSPTCLNFGSVVFYLSRHFGFCYGVENAIEISYKALEENPDKNIYLVSQMIHNQNVNHDLQSNGIRFIQDTKGSQLIPWEQIKSDDVVIVPAFGVPLETEKKLHEIGVKTEQYDTTCPFVKKVWNKAIKLGENDCTIIIHGTPEHEETRSTFSRSIQSAPSIVIRNMSEARILGEWITKTRPAGEFYEQFKGNYSSGFDPEIHLNRIGVINQTTMLASDTQTIVEYLHQKMKEQYGEEHVSEHFMNTRDTLCYATNDNQDATYKLLETNVDMAIVLGGYNSSNTSHIVELCEQKFPTYFINTENNIKTDGAIHHFDYHRQEERVTQHFLQGNTPLKIALTSGASCPDTIVDQVIFKILRFFDDPVSIEALFAEFD